MPYVLPLYHGLPEAVEHLLFVESLPLAGAETRPCHKKADVSLSLSYKKLIFFFTLAHCKHNFLLTHGVLVLPQIC